jgi:hypothetical protein
VEVNARANLSLLALRSLISGRVVGIDNALILTQRTGAEATDAAKKLGDGGKSWDADMTRELVAIRDSH